MISSSKPGTAALDLFSGKPQSQNFGRMGDFFEVNWIEASAAPRPLPVGSRVDLPDAYEYDGQTLRVADFLETTETVALIVAHDGEIRFEDYWLTGGPSVGWISWSMSKSFISALVGIAIREGSIASVDDPLVGYVPSLAGTAYDSATIRNALQMSSGARWNEDFSDPDADIHKLAAALAYQGTQADVLHQTESRRQPGTFWLYNSCDTQAVAMALTSATGMSVTEYTADRLCEPLGTEDPCGWIVDAAGMEMAGGGIIMSARDYAKFGELFRRGGTVGGASLLAESWVSESTQPQDPHVQLGSLTAFGETLPFGYGYQWWIPHDAQGEFQAEGIYNQFVYVDRRNDVVIVKLSAFRSYGMSPAPDHSREVETTAFLRAIASSLAA